MLHHGDQHRRHSTAEGGLLRFDQLEDESGVEGEDWHVGAELGHRAEHGHHASTCVEQGHRVDHHVTLRHPPALGDEAGVVGHSAMVEHGALGEPGGARRVQQGSSVARPDLRQGRLSGSGRREEALPLGEQDGLAKVRQPGTDGLQGLRHRVGAVRRQEEQSRGAGLSQHVLEFCRGVGRVDRYQHQARQGGPILEDHPFGDVGRPDRYVFARLEAGQEAPGHQFGIV